MSENILDMLSNISDEPNLVEVDSLDDLLRMIIQPNIEVGTIFYHLKTGKYFAVYILRMNGLSSLHIKLIRNLHPTPYT